MKYRKWIYGNSKKFRVEKSREIFRNLCFFRFFSVGSKSTERLGRRIPYFARIHSLRSKFSSTAEHRRLLRKTENIAPAALRARFLLTPLPLPKQKGRRLATFLLCLKRVKRCLNRGKNEQKVSVLAPCICSTNWYLAKE